METKISSVAHHYSRSLEKGSSEKATIVISTGRTIMDEIFGNEDSVSDAVELIIDGKSIVSLPDINIKLVYEIFNIDGTEKQFTVKSDRLNYVLVNYNKNNRLTNIKSLLRPILINSVKEIIVERKSV